MEMGYLTYTTRFYNNIAFKLLTMTLNYWFLFLIDYQAIAEEGTEEKDKVIDVSHMILLLCLAVRETISSCAVHLFPHSPAKG